MNKIYLTKYRNYKKVKNKTQCEYYNKLTFNLKYEQLNLILLPNDIIGNYRNIRIPIRRAYNQPKTK